MKALIVGAGIGGLTAAISLRSAGVEATVLERATELREAGAGLLLGANAVKVLEKLGLGEAVREIGAPTMVGNLFSWWGEELVSLSAEQVEDLVGAESFAVHRADLQSILLQAFGDEHVRLGKELTGFEQDEKNVRVYLAGGDEWRADLLIGADGIHSTVRQILHGFQSPVYAGYTAWRGIVEDAKRAIVPGSECGLESCGARALRFGLRQYGR